MVKTFDPKQVSLIFAGKIGHGYTDGTFIVVERDEPTFTKKIGVDGEGTRSKSNNKGGKITITLHQSSSFNDDLTALQLADELTNAGIGALAIKDNSGRTICAAGTAWIQKPANAEFAKEVSNRVWVIETDEIDMSNGGN